MKQILFFSPSKRRWLILPLLFLGLRASGQPPAGTWLVANENEIRSFSMGWWPTRFVFKGDYFFMQAKWGALVHGLNGDCQYRTIGTEIAGKAHTAGSKLILEGCAAGSEPDFQPPDCQGKEPGTYLFTWEVKEQQLILTYVDELRDEKRHTVILQKAP